MFAAYPITALLEDLNQGRWYLRGYCVYVLRKLIGHARECIDYCIKVHVAHPSCHQALTLFRVEESLVSFTISRKSLASRL